MSLFQSGELIAQIESTLTLLSERMKTFTGLGLNTDAKLLEPFAARLLNRLYGWSLTDPSQGNPTYQGFDLEDRTHSVAIQVSVQEPSGKIAHTIQHLTDEHRATFTDIRCFFLLHHQFKKAPALPVITIRTLLDELANKDPDYLREFLSFLQSELTITCETIIAQLSPGAKFLLQQLAWCAPDPIPFTLPGVEVFSAGQHVFITELTNLSLAKRSEDSSTFTLDHLIQEITRQQQTDIKKTETHRGGFLFLVKKTRTFTVTPPALLAALTWLDDVIPDCADEVIESTFVSLLPHAIAVATAAADYDIRQPTTRLLNYAANLEKYRGNYHTAEPLMRRALALDEAWVGPSHPDVAADLANLAKLLHETNRPAEAEPFMRRALAFDEKHLGPAHPRVAGHLSDLAQLLKDTNRLAEAEPLLRRALAIEEAHYGPSDPDVASYLSNLAQLLQDTNRLAEAEPLMARALRIVEDSLGSDHPNSVSVRRNLEILRAEMP